MQRDANALSVNSSRDVKRASMRRESDAKTLLLL